MVFWYGLPRKKDISEEWLCLRDASAAENEVGALGGGCSTAQAGGVLIWDLVTQKLCFSLPGCQTQDLCVIFYVFPQLPPSGDPPDPTAVPQQCVVVLLLAVHPGEMSPPTAL